MWEQEPPEVWEYLSLPGTKGPVSEDHYTVLRSPPNRSVTMSLFVLPAYGSNGYNGYRAQPMGGESHTSESLPNTMMNKI